MFEIDQLDAYGDFLLRSQRDMIFHLNLLKKQRCVVALYIGNTGKFVISSVVEVDEDAKRLYLDVPLDGGRDLIGRADVAITLVGSTADRVKLQARLAPLALGKHEGLPVFDIPLPELALRLQRREYFRIDTPRINPLRCLIPLPLENSDQTEQLPFPLNDISGGGLSLIVPASLANRFPPDRIFPDCHLEVPGEAVLSVNLRICEVISRDVPVGEPQVRVGCEFNNLPSSRQGVIERYIAKLARERKPGAL